ncbi:Uncharacterised protein [Leclercia adecarboxylata]|uniref:GTP-binding protein EngB n=1 Tax=Leclercia adecarboxylata TaxID=83655 RepID=A0A4U9HN74_9ENTR|nr:Uncharacterised protein [Leclercia adecarboxylata]
MRGVLKESLRKIVEELAAHDKPMMLIITKCDKKTPEDVKRSLRTFVSRLRP